MGGTATTALYPGRAWLVARRRRVGDVRWWDGSQWTDFRATAAGTTTADKSAELVLHLSRADGTRRQIPPDKPSELRTSG
jgi:hypothetical protein